MESEGLSREVRTGLVQGLPHPGHGNGGGWEVEEEKGRSGGGKVGQGGRADRPGDWRKGEKRKCLTADIVLCYF